MEPVQSILAASDTDLGKVIFGILFAAIWVISQVASVIIKKNEEAKRRRVQQGPVATPPPLRQSPARARPVPAPMRKQAPMRQPMMRKQTPPAKPQPARTKQLKLSRRLATPAPPPLPQRATPDALTPTAPARSTETNAGASTQISSTGAPVKRPTSISAPALHNWLRPSTLRQQFLLTEIFQPPIALRDPDSRI